jgi:hypothetical protein
MKRCGDMPAWVGDAGPSKALRRAAEAAEHAGVELGGDEDEDVVAEEGQRRRGGHVRQRGRGHQRRTGGELWLCPLAACAFPLTPPPDQASSRVTRVSHNTTTVQGCNSVQHLACYE